MGAITFDGYGYHSVGVGMDLLWKNPAPTYVFPVRTIPIDLSSYEAVLVVYKNTNSTDFYGHDIVYKDGLEYVSFIKNRTAATIFSRGATATDSGITFQTGYSGATAGTGYCIPYRIYGLSGICAPVAINDSAGTLWLFQEGVGLADIMGTNNGYTLPSGYSYQAPTITTSLVTIATGSSKLSYIASNNTIDFTPYSTLTIECMNNRNLTDQLYIGLMSEKAYSYDILDASQTVSAVSTRLTIEVDVSAINQSAYLQIREINGRTYTLYNAYLS